MELFGPRPNTRNEKKCVIFSARTEDMCGSLLLLAYVKIKGCKKTSEMVLRFQESKIEFVALQKLAIR